MQQSGGGIRYRAVEDAAAQMFVLASQPWGQLEDRRTTSQVGMQTAVA